MRQLIVAWKATLVVNLLSVAACVGFLALVCGQRLPLGTFGVSVLNDPRGRPFVVIDHASTRGWLLGYDARFHRLQTWEGTIRLQ